MFRISHRLRPTFSSDLNEFRILELVIQRVEDTKVVDTVRRSSSLLKFTVGLPGDSRP